MIVLQFLQLYYRSFEELILKLSLCLFGPIVGYPREIASFTYLVIGKKRDHLWVSVDIFALTMNAI